MATTTARKPKKLTRADRENARNAVRARVPDGRARYVTIIGHGAMLCAKACEDQDPVEAAQRSYLAELSSFVAAPAR